MQRTTRSSPDQSDGAAADGSVRPREGGLQKKVSLELPTFTVTDHSGPARSPRFGTPARAPPPGVPALDLSALPSPTQTGRTPRPKSARIPGAASLAAAADEPDPFETAYDLLRAGLGSTSDAVLALRARPAEGAVLLGEPSCGVLLRSPPYPAWLQTWVPLQSTVLCHGANGALALGVLARGMLGDEHGPALDAAAAVIDAVLRPPSHCALQVLVWRGVGARVAAVSAFDELARIGAQPVPPAPEPRPDDPCYLRLLRAAGALAQGRAGDAAAALGLPEAYVRTLVEVELEPGRMHTVAPPHAQAPGSREDSGGAAAERYAVAGALMYALAADEAAALANTLLPQPPEAVRTADVELVVPPAAQRSPLAQYARQTCAYLLQESENQLLSGQCAIALPPPTRPELRLETAPRAALVAALAEAVNDMVDAGIDDRERLLPPIADALMGRRPALRIDRTLPSKAVARMAEAARAMAAAIGAADCMAVHCPRGAADAGLLDETGIGAALARCADMFRWRFTLAEFMRAYAPLVAERCGGDMPAPEAVRRVCGDAGGQFRVIGRMVLMDAALHTNLTTHLARLRPECQRLVDELALERERLRAAFPDEYAWLDGASGRGVPATPRRGAPDRVHQMTEFMRATAMRLTSRAAPAAEGARVPWTVVLCARVMRARGWRDLAAACEAVRLVHADRAAAPLTRATALMHLADACAIAYAHVQPGSGDAAACESALQTAVRSAALLVADSLIRIMLMTPESLPRALASATNECAGGAMVALDAPAVRALFAELAAVRCANQYAARRDTPSADPMAVIAAMSEPDTPRALARLKAVAQCQMRAAGRAPVAPPGIRREWAATGEGEPCAEPSMPRASDLVCALFDRARFASLCALDWRDEGFVLPP